jgi:hypothetical protein
VQRPRVLVTFSGVTDEPVDWIGALGDLDALLGAADVLVISLLALRRTGIARRSRPLGRPPRRARRR